MLTKIGIINFKSIKNIQLEPSRFNIFIGDTNSGKTNILEVLGLLCGLNSPGQINKYVRFQSFTNLFYDDLPENLVKIALNGINLEIKFTAGEFNIETPGYRLDFNYQGNHVRTGRSGPNQLEPILRLIKYYDFKDLEEFNSNYHEYLLTPNGENLFSIIFANNKNRDLFKDILAPFNYLPVFKPQKLEIEYQKQVDDIIINYPYKLLSGTLRALIFYTFLIESNKDSVLVFEEPEAHTFPYYTKFLGEKIANDKSNQYFLITHNPYFLRSIIEKAPKGEINVYVTYMKNYETKIAKLSEENIAKLLEIDPFFNMNQFYEED